MFGLICVRTIPKTFLSQLDHFQKNDSHHKFLILEIARFLSRKLFTAKNKPSIQIILFFYFLENVKNLFLKFFWNIVKNIFF